MMDPRYRALMPPWPEGATKDELRAYTHRCIDIVVAAMIAEKAAAEVGAVPTLETVDA